VILVLLWLSGRARKPSFIDLLHEPAYDLYSGSAVGFLAVPGILHKLTRSHGFNPKEDPFLLTYYCDGVGAGTWVRPT